MSKRPKDNKVGPWAEQKLDALRRGLDYYTTYLKNQHFWRKIYVDAFAGPGLSEVRTRPKDDKAITLAGMADLFEGNDFNKVPDPVQEEVRFLKGSPRIALDLNNPFDHYVFIERDTKRLAELEAMRAEYANRRSIDIHLGDANEALLSLLRSGFSKRTHRAYVFLDPFGIQVPWSTIEMLAATEAIEVLLNFPLGMAINRMMPKHGNVPDGWRISLDAFFGTPDWKQHAYSGDFDLVGHEVKHNDSQQRLLAWYRERLKIVFGFVSEAKLITNTRGGSLYYLIWAGPRAEGLKGANYILTMKSPKSKKKTE